MPVPVFLIGGYLGVGKTTLILRALEHLPGRTAVVVNDFGPVGLDGKLLGQQGLVGVVQEIPGGCLCCTVQDQLPDEVDKVLSTAPDRVLVEPSGVARLGPLRELLREGRGVGPVLGAALVKAEGFDPRQVSPLLRDQLEAADLWALTHLSTATDREMAALRTFLNTLYPARPLVSAETLAASDWFSTLAVPPQAETAGGLIEPVFDPPEVVEPPRQNHGHGHGVEGHEADGLIWPVAVTFDFACLLAFFARLGAGEVTRGRCVRAKGVFHTEAGAVLLEWTGSRVADRPMPWTGPSQFDAVLLTPAPGDWDSLWPRLEACVQS